MSKLIERSRQAKILFDMFCRKWQGRRVVYTKEEIFICSHDEEIVRDSIPLAEIVCIQEMIEKSDTRAVNGLRSQSPTRDDKSMFVRPHSIVISTIPDGYNSGRQYYFQTETEEQSSTLQEQWTKLAVEARNSRDRRTKFQRSQEGLSRVLNSAPLQMLSTSIIVLVRIPRK